MSSELRVRMTRDYGMFECDEKTNRPVDLSGRKALRDSMKRYGFIKGCHITCRHGKGKKLIVKMGQHRLAMAIELGLPVWYLVTDEEFDTAIESAAAKVWKEGDYAVKYAGQGMADYQEVIDFHQQRGITVGISAALLAGVTGFSTIKHVFRSGGFKIKDRELAAQVADLYSKFGEMAKGMRNIRLLTSLVAVCRLKGFNTRRLLQGAARLPEELKNYGSREGYLEMIEKMYNFGRSPADRVAIKVPAQNLMMDRNFAVPNGHANGHAKTIDAKNS